MIVPIQPNKYEREEAELVALEQEAETRPYNLRSKDGTTAGPNVGHDCVMVVLLGSYPSILVLTVQDAVI